jgi:hypothetical protein
MQRGYMLWWRPSRTSRWPSCAAVWRTPASTPVRRRSAGSSLPKA